MIAINEVGYRFEDGFLQPGGTGHLEIGFVSDKYMFFDLGLATNVFNLKKYTRICFDFRNKLLQN